MSGLFNLPPRTTRAGDSLLAKKASKKGKASSGAGPSINIKGGGGLLERIATITAMVNKNLGKYKDKYKVIRDEDELIEYVDACVKNGIVAIDTETNSLDPITCTIAGICFYTPGQKGVYVPINHVSYVTGVLVENQLDAEFVSEQLERLAKIKTVFFNAKFDVRVMWNQLKVRIRPYWDCYIAARLLNENEPENNLKFLHTKYVLDGEGDVFKFDTLFKGIPFTHIPINTGYMYAARDPEITFELFEFQKQFLDFDSEDVVEGPANVFHTIEMPLVPVVAEMEDTGIAFDFDFADKLSVEYNEKLSKAKQSFYDACDMYEEEIQAYRRKAGAGCKLADPINIGSPQQIAILLYDVLKLKSPDKEKPRGTGEEIIKDMDHSIPEAILKYREYAKILSTYVDKLPNEVNPKTGRIHASFNQMGTDTGRFSSSDPNMQNIPSENKDIRKMFYATPGYVLLSSDYSAQEPRITAHMSDDRKMIQAYLDGKDLYAEIASLAFNVEYDECLEKRPDGTTNKEGKRRRQMAKAIVLGVCYGKGVPAIAKDLGVTKKKAQEIYDKIMKLFPGLKNFMEDSEEMAKELGYVDTIWGRKRRLPNINLEPYEFSYIDGVSKDFDPLAFDEDFDDNNEVDEDTKEYFIGKLEKVWSRSEKQKIIQAAKEEGIKIVDNGGYIAEAKRQVVNSRIQGSAADQTKKAMILIGNSEELKELDFRLLLPVHDELIGECPYENRHEAAEIFERLMIEAAKELVVPSKCDVEITERWYGEEVV